MIFFCVLNHTIALFIIRNATAAICGFSIFPHVCPSIRSFSQEIDTSMREAEEISMNFTAGLSEHHRLSVLLRRSNLKKQKQKKIGELGESFATFSSRTKAKSDSKLASHLRCKNLRRRKFAIKWWKIPYKSWDDCWGLKGWGDEAVVRVCAESRSSKHPWSRCDSSVELLRSSENCSFRSCILYCISPAVECDVSVSLLTWISPRGSFFFFKVRRREFRKIFSLSSL